MFKTKKRKRLEEMQNYLQKLRNMELTFLQNGHYANKKNEIEIMYDRIKFILKKDKINNLSDDELLFLIKKIDECLFSVNKVESKKIEFIEDGARKINKVIIERITNLIKETISLINNSNILIKQDRLEEIPYLKIMNAKVKLEYYLENITQNVKIQELIAELGFILSKKKQFQLVKTKGEKYEKTCISI